VRSRAFPFRLLLPGGSLSAPRVVYIRVSSTSCRTPYNKRYLELAQARRSEWTALQQELKKAKDAVYSKLIKIPSRKIKDETEKKKFQERMKVEVHKEYSRLENDFCIAHSFLATTIKTSAYGV
jgi:hypothetical protein